MTQRFKILIEYDGGPYIGWQRQENGRSIQGEIEDAIFKYAQERVVLFGAGRTDSGVHALGQVGHFDLEKHMDHRKVRNALNAYLRPQLISIVTAEPVSQDFHARFSATRRYYRYEILNRAAPSALMRGRCWHVMQKLDEDAMREAAMHLIGTHDFSSFRAKECQAKSPIKTMEEIRIERVGDMIHCYFKAPSFLHHQVRNMIGTLVHIGMGKWHASQMRDILIAKDRTQAGPTAPPDGLYFLKVDYDQSELKQDMHK